MNEFNPDAELAELLRGERLESIEPVRRRMLDELYDHVVVLESDRLDDVTPGSALDLVAVNEEQYAEQLDALMQVSLQRIEGVPTGELQISGDGMYICLDDSVQGGLEVLGDGDAIRGTVARYAVRSIVPYEIYRNPEILEQATYRDDPAGLSVLLEDARLYLSDEDELQELGWVWIPLTYPSLQIHRVVPGVSTDEREREAVEPTVDERLKGDNFLELCRVVENDLTYNKDDYTPSEFAARYQEHLESLRECLGDVETDRPLLVTAHGMRIASGTTTELSDALAHYECPTIIRTGDSWRVAHGLSLITGSEDNPYVLVHVLPESIRAARYIL